MIEKRRVPGRAEPATCVPLDSVQSQANRMELALQEALEAWRLVTFPMASISRPAFSSSSTSPVGACAVKSTSSTSTGPKGGGGPKFERAMVSEVVGIGAEKGDLLRGVRRDPLEIRAAVKVVKAADKSYLVDPGAKEAVSPSEVNHSSVPFPKARKEKTDDNYYSGVTIEYAEQTTTLSLVCLRRLRFPIVGKANGEADAAARTVLAALGLCAATLAFESGMGLRSRCLLWPDGPMEWELLARPGEVPRKFSLNGDEAVALLNAAIKSAAKTALPWENKPVPLKPSAQLLKLVRLSQLEAVKEGPDAST
jgi:CRISPR-associated protein Csb1